MSFLGSCRTIRTAVAEADSLLKIYLIFGSNICTLNNLFPENPSYNKYSVDHFT